MTSKNRLMTELNLTPAKFGQLLTAVRLADKTEYDADEVALLKSNGSTAGQGFTPTAKGDRPQPIPQTAANTQALTRVTDTGVGVVREQSLSTAGIGAQAIAAITQQRETVKGQLKDEIKRLTDPNLFFAELMDEVANELVPNQTELDFFGCYAPLALPEPRQIKMLGTSIAS